MPLNGPSSDAVNASSGNASSHTNFPGPIETGLEVGIQNPDGHGPILVPDTPAAYVDHGRWPETMEVARQGDESPQTVTEDPTNAGQLELAESSSAGSDAASREKSRGSFIWGFKKRTVIVALIAGLLVVGAIVGAAVGGTQASKGSSQQSPPSALPSTTSPTSHSPLPPGISQLAKPRMSFKLHTFELPNYEGRSQFMYAPGGYRSPYPIRSYTWSPGAPGEIDDDRLRCSVALCNDNKRFGWWGRSERRKENIQPNATIVPPNVLNIECDTDFKEPMCPELSYLSTFITVPVMETGKPLSDTHN